MAPRRDVAIQQIEFRATSGKNNSLEAHARRIEKIVFDSFPRDAPRPGMKSVWRSG